MPLLSCAKICQYMLGVKDVAQGARVCQYVSRKQKNEPIRGLISHEFIFFQMGMLGTLIIGPNTFQVALCAKC